VDLSMVLAPATLHFWSWEQTEDYSGYDTRKVYLSSNGSTWTEVWNSSDNAAAWYQVELDVSSYVGGDLYVRFEFDTVDSSYNSYRGWYVDDVEVLAGMAPSNPPAVLAITPDTGSAYSETPVTIGGAGFQATPFVLLGGTPLLTVTYVNSTTLEGVVPAGMEPGLYDLTVVNPDCQDDVLAGAFTVVAECISPTVELEGESPVELGEPAHFTATLLSGTGPYTFSWDFGGAGYGTGLDTANPAYTYTAAGSYTVTLLVENACGTDTAALVVEVLEPCLEPLVQASSDSPAALGQAMHFTATLLSGTAPISYSWDFGDGVGSSAEANPAYTYAAAGSYTVTLLVENACGTDTAELVVEVVCETPTVSFASDSPAALGQAMHFTSMVSGSGPFSYTWDFGDGLGSSVEAHPVYTYTAVGTYTVTLSVEGACGSDSYSALVVVEEPLYMVYLPLVFKNAAP
jgi:PKD repeat protein